MRDLGVARPPEVWNGSGVLDVRTQPPRPGKMRKIAHRGVELTAPARRAAQKCHTWQTASPREPCLLGFPIDRLRFVCYADANSGAKCCGAGLKRSYQYFCWHSWCRYLHRGGAALQCRPVLSPRRHISSVMAGGAAGEQQTPPGQHHHDHQCCLFCHLPLAVDPVSTAVAFAAPAPLTRYVAWTVDPAFVPFAHAGKHARARRPPSLS